MNSSTRFWLILVAAVVLVTLLAGGAGLGASDLTVIDGLDELEHQRVTLLSPGGRP